MDDKYGQAQQFLSKGMDAAVTNQTNQKQLLMQQAKAKFDQLSSRRSELEKSLQDKTLPDALYEMRYNEYAAISGALNPGLKLPGIKDIQPEDRKMTQEVVNILAHPSANASEKLKAVQGYMAKNMSKATDTEGFLKNVDSLVKQEMGGDVMDINQGDRTIQGRVNPAGEITPVDGADTENTALMNARTGQANSENSRKSGERQDENERLKETSLLLTALRDLQNVKDPKGMAKIVDAIPMLKERFGNGKGDLKTIQKAIVDQLAGAVIPNGAKPAAQAAPKEKGLLWNGRPLKDTPANRAWVEQQKKAVRSKAPNKPGKNPDVGASRG